MNVSEWIKQQEQEIGHPIYRRIKVAPATEKRFPDGTIIKEPKKPFGERNTWSPEEIGAPNSKKSSRGYSEEDFTDFSLYLKHMPGCYCVDIDTKDLDDCCFADNLFNCGTYYTETKKGFHFYIKCPDVPDFKNELDVLEECDGDFLGRKGKVGNNTWEVKSRVVKGDHWEEMPWDDIKGFFKEEEMNKDKKKKTKKKANTNKQTEDDEDETGLETFVPDTQIQGYLERLSKKRLNDYSPTGGWMAVGIILFNTYKGKMKGLKMWDKWSSKSEKYEEGVCEDKWQTFVDEHPDKVGWKTLRGMANIDSPVNEFEQLYNTGGIDALVKRMNQFLVFKKKGAEYIMIDETIKKEDEEINWDIYKHKGLVDYFTKYTFQIEIENNGKTITKNVNPFNLWNQNINRRDVKTIAFDARPVGEGQDPNIFNIWQGYNVMEDEAEEFDVNDAQPMIDHLLNIWCKGNVEYFTYLTKWFAFLLQRPYAKIGVMIALKSKQGAGKGIVMEFMKDIMGRRHFDETATLRDILGEFNSGLEGRVLIDLDEAYWGGDKKLEGQMKNIITQESVQVNKKGKEVYAIRNTTAFMITTNNDLFVGVSEGQRRVVAFELDDKYAGPSNPVIKAYVEKVRGCKSHERVPRHIYGAFAKYLYNINLDHWNPRDLPKTDLIQDQIERGWSPTTTWWFSILKDESFGLPDWTALDKEASKKEFSQGAVHYTKEMEDWGHIVNGVNGIVAQRTKKIKDEPLKLWQKNEHHWTDADEERFSDYEKYADKSSVYHISQDYETRKKEYIRQKYTEGNANIAKKDPTKIGGFNDTADPVNVIFEGEQVWKYKTETEISYQGYFPKFLFEVYCKDKSIKKKADYITWCKEMRKMWKVEEKKHAKDKKTGKRPITWQIPMDIEVLREQFNEYQQYDYDFNGMMNWQEEDGQEVEWGGTNQQNQGEMWQDDCEDCWM